jgi:hypothetical protein
VDQDASASREYRLLIALGVLVALVFLRAPGSSDVSIWLGWQERALNLGLLKGYKTRWVDYPPLSFTILWVTGKLSLLAGIKRHLGLKVMLLVFLLATLACAQAWRRNVRITAALLWLVIPDSVALGYLDVMYAPTLLGMVWAMHAGRSALALLLLACSCLLKWQPLLLAPFVVAHLVRQGALSSPRQAARVLWPTLGAVLAVVIIFNPGIFGAFGRALRHPTLSSNALNFQWILTYALRVRYPDTFEALQEGAVWRLRMPSPLDSGAIPWSSVALWAMRIPFFALYFFVLGVFARRPRRFEEFLSFSFVGYASYYTMATGVHENHLFPGCLIMLGLAALDLTRMSTYLLWTTIHNVNAFFFYGCAGEEPPWSRVVGVDLSLVLAAFNVLVFILLFLEYVWDEIRGQTHLGERPA